MITRCNRCDKDSDCKAFPYFVGICQSRKISNEWGDGRGSYGYTVKWTYKLSERRPLYICKACQDELFVAKCRSYGTPKGAAIGLALTPVCGVICYSLDHWWHPTPFEGFLVLVPTGLFFLALWFLIMGYLCSLLCFLSRNGHIESEVMLLGVEEVKKEFTGVKVTTRTHSRSEGDVVVLTPWQASRLTLGET